MYVVCSYEDKLKYKPEKKLWCLVYTGTLCKPSFELKDKHTRTLQIKCGHNADRVHS